MNTTYIKIEKKHNGKIQYLTEVLPQIPTNTILYKKLTGLGATYGELKADRNSIILEPNVPVIKGKCKDPKHKNDNLFGVYENVTVEKIVKYLQASKEKHIKLLSTPESFSKIKTAFEELDMDIYSTCYLLFDECHKIVKDVDYREDITLPSTISSCSTIKDWCLPLRWISQTHDSLNRDFRLWKCTLCFTMPSPSIFIIPIMCCKN